jgi:hypothetical protein
VTNFFPNANFTNQGGDIAQSAGTAPLGTGLMQGNPYDSASRQNNGVYPPVPQVGAGAAGVPDVANQIAEGYIPVNVQPTNVATAPGTDSLMAQLSRGQVILNQSTYGQGTFAPAAGGQPGSRPRPCSHRSAGRWRTCRSARPQTTWGTNMEFAFLGIVALGLVALGAYLESRFGAQLHARVAALEAKVHEAKAKVDAVEKKL